MPDKSLRKLESYQSGGSIGSGSNGCNDNNSNNDDDDDINDENRKNNKNNHHANNIDITIAINDNNVNYVNRAKTKRDNASGTTTTTATTLGANNNNGKTNPSSPSVHPPLLAQFSLIGQAEDHYDDDDDRNDNDNEGGSTIIEDGNAWWQGYRRRIHHHRNRRSAVSLFAIGISCLTLFVILMAIGLNGANTNNGGGTDSSSIEHDHDGERIPTSPTTYDSHDQEQQIQIDTASCPMQSSYSVPFDIMELKNSSTVENVNYGAVATDHPLCSQIGLSILRDEGGNAADATVASALCLGVVNPASSGIGGGAFILVHNDGDDDEFDVDVTTGPIFEDARASSPDGNDDRRGGAAKRRRKVDRTEFIDCRETAPRNAMYDMFESNPESSVLGGLAIAIPGELRGLELLHHRHGSLPWSTLVRPSLELARNGFVIETYLADAIRSKAKHFRTMPNLGRTFTKNNDGVTLLEEGDLLVRKRYAETLEAIMDGGADAVYGGELADRLAKDIQDAGGIITSEDISSYRPVLRDPLISRVAGYTIAGAPPPSSGGGVIIGALRFLSGFATPYSATADALSKHWYVEACRHVFAIRMSLSDPKFAPEENQNAVNDLIEGEYMETLRRMTLDDGVLDLSQYGGQRWAQLKNTDGGGALVDAQEGDRRRRRRAEGTRDVSGSRNNRVSRDMRLFNYLEDHGTTSLSIVDKHRNTVTMTSSVNLNFGSKVVSPSTGIILNNQMDDFSSPGLVNYFGVSPSESNYVAPGKRPLSSMAPTMVFRDTNHHGPTETDSNGKISGKLVLSLGASGGPKIITSVLQTILNYAFVGMPLYESISAPRVHNQLLYHGAAGTNVEEDTLPQGPDVRLSKRTRVALERRGHKLIAADFLGTVQAVAVDSETGTLTAVSDIRKQGTPAGY